MVRVVGRCLLVVVAHDRVLDILHGVLGLVNHALGLGTANGVAHLLGGALLGFGLNGAGSTIHNTGGLVAHVLSGRLLRVGLHLVGDLVTERLAAEIRHVDLVKSGVCFVGSGS